MKPVFPIVFLILALLQPLAGALAPALGIGTPIGAATADAGAPEQPLPAFFSIWSLIFLGFILFALTVIKARESWMKQISGPLALAAIFNIFWMLSAQLIVYQPLDFLLLFPILWAAWLASYRFDKMRGMGGSAAKFFADMTSGLLSGWITVALAISLPLTLRSFTDLGPSDHVWPMLWLTLITAAGGAYIFASRISKSPWFFVAAGWGLLGIVLNNWFETDLHLLAITAGLVGGMILFLRWRRGASGARQAASAQ